MTSGPDSLLPLAYYFLVWPLGGVKAAGISGVKHKPIVYDVIDWFSYIILYICFFLPCKFSVEKTHLLKLTILTMIPASDFIRPN